VGNAQAWELLVGEADKEGAPGGPRTLVETGSMGVDQPQLGDLGFEPVSADPVLDSMKLAQQVSDPTPFVTVEIAPDPGAKVVGLPNIDHCSVAIEEHVDPRLAGESIGQVEL
jgi:hypothetical protein